MTHNNRSPLIVALLALLALSACEAKPSLHKWVRSQDFIPINDWTRASTLGEKIESWVDTTRAEPVRMYRRTHSPLMDPQSPSESRMADTDVRITDASSIALFLDFLNNASVKTVFQNATTINLRMRNVRVRTAPVFLPAIPPRSDQPQLIEYFIHREIVVGDLQITQLDAKGHSIDVGVKGAYSDDGAFRATRMLAKESHITGVDLVVGYDPRSMEYLTSEAPTQLQLRPDELNRFDELSLRLRVTRQTQSGSYEAVIDASLGSPERPTPGRSRLVPMPGTAHSSDELGGPPGNASGLTQDQINRLFESASPLGPSQILGSTEKPESRWVVPDAKGWISRRGLDVAFFIDIEYIRSDLVQLNITKLVWR